VADQKTALAVPAQEKISKNLADMFPPEPGSTEDKVVRLLDLPKEMQEEVLVAYGLPADIARANVLFLGGKPYPDKDALLDLASKRNLTRLKADPLPTQKCVDLGCSDSKVVGYKAQGQEYTTWKDAFLALRGKYPNMKDPELKRKIYSNRERIPAQDWQRAHYSRATAVFRIKTGMTGDDEVTCELVGDCCPHNSTSVTASSLSRMAQTRAVNCVLRAGTKLPGASAEELAHSIVDTEGKVDGARREEAPPESERAPLDIEVTDDEQAEIEKLATILHWNRGALDYHLGQQQTAAALLVFMRAEVSKFSKPGAQAAAAGPQGAPRKDVTPPKAADAKPPDPTKGPNPKGQEFFKI